MNTIALGALAPNEAIEADLAIVGGGPVGLTIAREFFGTAISVLVLESGGLEESPAWAELNAVEAEGVWTPAQAAKREAFHGALSAFWDGQIQAFGVRCRGLGGSTRAWAGKSAAFDRTDFAARDWVAHSGWPIAREDLDPFLERAAQVLNLGPNSYDDGLWSLLGRTPPSPAFDPARLRAFFWQFARSRLDPMDLMRFGPEFLTFDAPNVRVLLDATVTEVRTDAASGRLDELCVASLSGVRTRVKARAVVLAAGAIENARLLLNSRAAAPAGLGNAHDQVGRFLMDHPGARIGYFPAPSAQAVIDRFGFYGLPHQGQTHLYTHGLSMSPQMQAEERLLNSAVYMLEDRAPDDPWGALRRLIKRQSDKPLADLLSIAKSPGLLAKGVGMKLFESRLMPSVVRGAIVNLLLRWNSDFVAQEFQSRGLPHKLNGLFLDAITEQPPNPDNRVTLSDKVDALGVPKAKVDWKLDPAAAKTMIRLGEAVVEEFARTGLPVPTLEPWVAERRPQDAVIIDMAHTAGTTRMSADPSGGVVDLDCQVHGAPGVYVAGGSVFPTSGHANPTLMMLALAIRLSDRLKAVLTAPAPKAAAPTNATVLVTGATGMIGKTLTSRLLAAGYAVRGTYNRTPGTAQGVDWVRLDLAADDDLGPVVEGVDAVIHLAAELGDTAMMERVNVAATTRLLGAAQRAGVRYFGYASSVVVYGSPKTKTVSETAPTIDPAGPIARQYIADGHMREYARTKAMAEAEIAGLKPSIPVDIFRPTVVVDAQRLLESARWNRVRSALMGGQNTQFVMVEQVTDAMIHLMERRLADPNAQGVEAFNLCEDAPLTYGEVWSIARRARPELGVKRTPTAPGLFNAMKALKAGHGFTGRRNLGQFQASARRLLATGFRPNGDCREAIGRDASAKP